MRYLLDTSAAIVLRDVKSAADDRMTALASMPALSVISVVELEGGTVADPRLASSRRQRLDRMLQLFPVLDFDTNCAAAYRRIVEARGFSRVRLVDRMIGATALVHDLTVITTNPRDFLDIPELMIEAWPAVSPHPPSATPR